MPLYEHKCRDCGARLDEGRAVKGTTNGTNRCPKCGSTNTGKVFSLFARASSAGPAPAPSPRRSC